MRTLKYGYLGEDDAQKIFLKNYLETLNSEKYVFEFDEDFPIKATNDKSVKRLFNEAIQRGFSDYQQDAFFVGIDLDTYESKRLQELFEEMKSQINERFRAKTCIFIPVQCIEHWLWHLKIKEENPNTTKNESLEKYPRTKAKEILYGSKKATTKLSNPIVNALSQNFDIAWLESRSASFLHFHRQVLLLLSKLS